MNTIKTGDDSECALCKMARPLLVVLAIFLFMLFGCLLAGGCALTVLLSQSGVMSPVSSMTGELPTSGLGVALFIVPALVLCLIVLILIMVLLWRFFSTLRKLADIFKLLPLLKNMAAGMNTAAEALVKMEWTLRAAEVPVRLAGSVLYEAGEKVDVTIPTVGPDMKPFDLLGTEVMVGLKPGEGLHLFGAVKDKLQAAGAQLKGRDNPDSLEMKLDETANHCRDVAAGLKAVSEVLAQL